MKGDIPAAAFRLLTNERLIVRTNYAPERPEQRLPQPGAQGGHRSGARQPRPVLIKGKRYESINQAIVALHSSHTAITKMLKDGRAKMAEQPLA